MTRTGRCSCGEVRYEIEGNLGPLVNCHCQFCRRAHGAAFATVSWAEASALRITAGEELVRKFSGKGGFRAFCERCGTRLFNGLEKGPPFIALIVASLDEEPERGPVMHLNLESKAPWYEILDDLPRHDSLPPEVRRAIEGIAE